MLVFHVKFEMIPRFKDLRTVVALSALEVTRSMNMRQVSLQVVLAFRYIRADVTLEYLDVTNTMYGR